MRQTHGRFSTGLFGIDLVGKNATNTYSGLKLGDQVNMRAGEHWKVLSAFLMQARSSVDFGMSESRRKIREPRFCQTPPA